MLGTMNCTYETPCGWCTKWDKKCNEKITERGLRVETNPVDDYSGITFTNKMCESEEDHEWECCGISTAGSTYRCKICGTYKSEPIQKQESVTISTYTNEIYNPCSECDKEGWDMPECKECNAKNDFRYFERRRTNND